VALQELDTATINLNFYVGDGTKRFTINNFATVNTSSVNTMGLDELVSKINSEASAKGVPIVAMNDGGRLKLVTTNGETIAIEAEVNVTGGAPILTLIIVSFWRAQSQWHHDATNRIFRSGKGGKGHHSCQRNFQPCLQWCFGYRHRFEL